MVWRAKPPLDPLACWRDWTPDLRGSPIESGHYVPEENPDATVRALLDFFKSRT
jgi:haloacetate dehalogenase